MKVVFTFLRFFIYCLLISSFNIVFADISYLPTAPTFTSPTSHLWNLQDADILSFINEISRETGKNFIVDPRVSGKITIVSSKPLHTKDIYPVFLSTLQTLGYTAMQSGNIIKIIPVATSSQQAGFVADDENPGITDQRVVRVVALEHVNASQLIPILRPMMPQWSQVSAYMPGNLIILSGHAQNIQNLIRIIRKVDRSASKDIEIIGLEHASADQLVSVLDTLENNNRESGEQPQVSLAADIRSNTILMSGNQSARLRMRLLISQLDTPVNGDKGNTEVIYLHYLKATDFAKVLDKIAQNALGRAPQAQTTPDGLKKENATPDHLTSIQAEPNTNALVITAPPSLMFTLKQIINKLDIRPAQVLVEAIIVDIDDSDLQNLGIQWGRILNSKQALASAITEARNPQDASSAVLNFQQGLIGIIPGGELGAILSFLRTQKGTDILSTPSVMVLDNQKATIEVGEEVPEKTGEYATTGSTSTVTPFTTISRKPVTLKMTVTPQINTGNSVHLKIELQNDSLKNPEDISLTPLTNTSKISNSVLINSSDILVLGGLISRDTKDTVEKVPLLGNIPLLGRAFQRKIHDVKKKSLMVFIKPIIVNTREQGLQITNGKYDFMRTEQLRWEGREPPDLRYPSDQLLPRRDGLAQIPQPF